jgi:hypothetical protein
MPADGEFKRTLAADFWLAVLGIIDLFFRRKISVFGRPRHRPYFRVFASLQIARKVWLRAQTFFVSI